MKGIDYRRYLCKVLNNKLHLPLCSIDVIVSTRVTPAGGIDNDTRETPRDNTGNGESEDPASVDPSHHAPVDGAPRARAETNSDGGTGDALSRRDGKLWREMLAHVSFWDGTEDVLSCVARTTVITEPSSMEKPREGE